MNIIEGCAASCFTCEHSWCSTVNLLPVFQIAAKIGGDAGPPVSNSTAADGFSFTAQKRQLEDTNTGDCTFILFSNDIRCRESLADVSHLSLPPLTDEPESKKLAAQSDLESAKALCELFLPLHALLFGIHGQQCASVSSLSLLVIQNLSPTFSFFLCSYWCTARCSCTAKVRTHTSQVTVH